MSLSGRGRAYREAYHPRKWNNLSTENILDAYASRRGMTLALRSDP